MMHCITSCLLAVIVTSTIAQPEVEMDSVRKAKLLEPELFYKAPERAARYGYPMETHYVTTEDGFILGLHRIPGKKGAPPILFQHGLTSMSDCWLAYGNNRSLALQLADLGYDIWLGNVRGNLYSRNHTFMKPSDPKFWTSSWHELGLYDLSATIDYILDISGHSRLFYVGHSMGVTMSFVLLSMRPEYNAKIRLHVSLSPPIFMDYSNSKLLTAAYKNSKIIKAHMEHLATFELLPYSVELIAFTFFLCREGSATQKTCLNFAEDISGKSDGLNMSDLPLIIVLTQGGHSVIPMWHYMQLMKSGKFQMWDYGPEKNLEMYSSRQPPEYDLNKITVPVAIHYGETDNLVKAVNAVRISKALPNVVESRRVPRKFFNHFDFFGHIKVKELLNDHIVNTLKNY